jgi:hypothetical protein
VLNIPSATPPSALNWWRVKLIEGDFCPLGINLISTSPAPGTTNSDA